MIPSIADRIWAKIEVLDNGCWQWTGSLIQDGYGSIRVSGPNRRAHRVSYELHVGPIPTGLVLDHLCRNRGCVNPAHLEPVTPGENLRRGERAMRTHCPRGHEYTPKNTRTNNGKRHCRKCGGGHQARYRARKAARRQAEAL